MGAWQLQEAKQKFSELVERASTDGPQVVTRRGEEVVVVVSIKEFKRLQALQPDFKAFLLGGPDLTGVPLERSKELPRDVDL